jgi:cell division protein FtsB
MKKVFSFLFNKFTLTGLAFLVWMTFFDQNDWMTQQETKRQLQDTKDHIHFLTVKTEEMERELKLLQSDPQKLEQFAREKYRMKKENEDLYIIERK